MIKIHCNVCGKELNEPGALLFSPPDSNGVCIKGHICKDCYESYFEPVLMNPAERKDSISNSNWYYRILKKFGDFCEMVGKKILNPFE